MSLLLVDVSLDVGKTVIMVIQFGVNIINEGSVLKLD